MRRDEHACTPPVAGVFAPDGSGIAAHGFTGALHIWLREGPDGGWLPRHALGGHFGPGGWQGKVHMH